MLEQNKAIVRRFRLEITNEGKLDVADEIFAPTITFNGQDITLDSFLQIVQMWRSAFPDVEYTLDDLIAEGERVVERWTGKGTHKGELFGISPTGKKVTGTGIGIHRIVDGKIVELVEITDGLGLMQQLGVVPSIG